MTLSEIQSADLGSGRLNELYAIHVLGWSLGESEETVGGDVYTPILKPNGDVADVTRYGMSFVLGKFAVQKCDTEARRQELIKAMGL